MLFESVNRFLNIFIFYICLICFRPGSLLGLSESTGGIAEKAVQGRRSETPALKGNLPAVFSLHIPFPARTNGYLGLSQPHSPTFGGKNSSVGNSMRRNSSQGSSEVATHSFSGMQKS